MKKAFIIVALAASVCLLGGCDFFRRLAGRPTSRDLEEKLVRMEQQRLEDQHHLDSLEMLLDQPVPDPPAEEKTNVQDRVKSVTDGQTVLNKRYCVMIGSFRLRENAERQAAKAEKAGYPATLIPLDNGMTAVAVCPSDNLNEVNASLIRLRSESFCPWDAWVFKQK